jgi:transcriptional regulator with XRE-family HTH domain
MLGTELRKAREATGLSQESLGFKADVHRTYVSMLERGKASPTVETLFRLCKAMRIRPSEFIRRVEKASERGTTRRS